MSIHLSYMKVNILSSMSSEIFEEHITNNLKYHFSPTKVIQTVLFTTRCAAKGSCLLT